MALIDPKQLDLSGLEQQYKLPSGLLTAVMGQESGGNPNAVSPAGAQGLFQFMPATAKAYGINPFDPQQSAVGAARMYGDLSKQFQGDVPSMLAAYNWGSGNLTKKGMQNAPQETRDYIASIQNRMAPSGQYADSGNVKTDATIDNAPTELPEGAQLITDLPEGAQLIDSPQQSYLSKFTTDVSNAWKNRQADTEAHLNRNSYGRPTQLGRLHGLANIASFLTGDVPSAAIPGSVKQSFASGAQEIANALDSTEAGRTIGDVAFAAKNTSAELAKNHPKSAEKLGDILRPVGDVLNIAAAAPVAGAVLKGIRAAGEGAVTAKEAIGSLKATKFTPEDIHSSIHDSYVREKDLSNQFYGKAKEVAVGKPVANIGNLAKSVDDIVAEIEADPLHPGKSSLGKLKELRDKMRSTVPETVAKTANGEIPTQTAAPIGKFDMADMVDLRQLMNEQFGAKRFKFEGNNPYTKVGNIAREAIAEHSLKNKTFGKLISAADTHWRNNVKSFRSKTMQKLYKVGEDTKAYDAVKSGAEGILADDTANRATNVFKNSNSAQSLKVLRRVLPKAQANYIAKQVLQRNKGATTRVGSLGKAVTSFRPTPHGIANPIGHLADAITGKKLLPEKAALVKEAKKPTAKPLIDYADTLEQLEGEAEFMKNRSNPFMSDMAEMADQPVTETNLHKTAKKFDRKITNK